MFVAAGGLVVGGKGWEDAASEHLMLHRKLAQSLHGLKRCFYVSKGILTSEKPKETTAMDRVTIAGI